MNAAEAEATAMLRRALALSQELALAAAGGEAARAADLDAERRRLLESLRLDRAAIDSEGRSMLREIGELNDRSIGALEHRQRAVARDLDMAVAGVRAVRAYAATGPAGR